MSFFDDIENDVNTGYESDILNSFFDIISLDDVKTSEDMVKYIMNITGISEIIIALNSDYSENNIKHVLDTFDFNKLHASYNFEYKIHTEEKDKIRYVVIPKDDDNDIRLLIRIRKNYLQFDFYNYREMHWQRIHTIYWLFDKNHSIDYIITQIKVHLSERFANIKPLSNLNIFKLKFILK